MYRCLNDAFIKMRGQMWKDLVEIIERDVQIFVMIQFIKNIEKCMRVVLVFWEMPQDQNKLFEIDALQWIDLCRKVNYTNEVDGEEDRWSILPKFASFE